MARGTLFRNCDWGLDYSPGQHVPAEYARRGRVLGRLTVLYVHHLLETNNGDSAVRALTVGLKFSHDLANDGSLFAALNAKNLLVSHLRVVSRLARLKQLSAAQRSQLQIAVASLGKGLDWQMAAKRDLETLRETYVHSTQASAALTGIVSSYLAALNDESMLPSLDQAIEASPEDLAGVIPITTRILEH